MILNVLLGGDLGALFSIIGFSMVGFFLLQRLTACVMVPEGVFPSGICHGVVFRGIAQHPGEGWWAGLSTIPVLPGIGSR